MASNALALAQKVSILASACYMENLQILTGIAKYTANFTPPNRTQGITYQEES